MSAALAIGTRVYDGARILWGAPIAVRFRGGFLAIAATLLLARVDGKSPAEYLTDPERDTVRRTALHLIDARPTRLATLAADFERNIRR